MTNTQGPPSICCAADAVRIVPHDRMIRFYDGPINDPGTLEHVELPFTLENLDVGTGVFYVDRKGEGSSWLGLTGFGDLIAMVNDPANDGRSRAEYGLADKLRITVPG